MSSPISLCFIAQNSFGALAKREGGFIGGIEFQIPLMARWFVDQGFNVSMICWDEGFGEETEIDGVRVVSLCGRHDGIPGLRMLTPRWTSLNRALDRIQPDVVYYNYGDMEFGQIAMWAQRNQVPVVYSVANNMVCQKELPSLEQYREKVLYKYGLVRATRIITQTTEQQQTLKENFGLDSTMVPMPNPGF